jgi:hypothetical protein
MRLLFVHHVIEDRGSAQDMHHYVHAARAQGHEIALYGRPKGPSPFEYTLDVDSADAVIFIFEWTTKLQFGDRMDYGRLITRIPRRRRVVLDCDSKYNDAVQVLGDYNHLDQETANHWVAVCNSLSDKIFQPTLHPRRPNVRTFFFHAYNPAWEMPLEVRNKEYGLVYVGNNWFRWRSLRRVLGAVEPVRERVGRIALVGNGWGAPAPWANPSLIEDAYKREPEYLEKLGVEIVPPVRFDEVVGWMGRGVMSPVIYRPVFDHLRFITCRTFETPAAGAIPLFAQERSFVEEIYGPAAGELALPGEKPHEKILDILERPEHYAHIVCGMRRRMREQYSYEVQLRQLIDIVES